MSKQDRPSSDALGKSHNDRSKMTVSLTPGTRERARHAARALLPGTHPNCEMTKCPHGGLRGTEDPP